MSHFERPRGFPLQPEADPSEALWRKKHAGMTDLGEGQILRSNQLGLEPAWKLYSPRAWQR